MANIESKKRIRKRENLERSSKKVQDRKSKEPERKHPEKDRK